MKHGVRRLKLSSVTAQEPSLALVPPSEHTVKVSVAETAGSHGLHDAMRHGQRSLAAEAAPKHPLESRLSLVRLWLALLVLLRSLTMSMVTRHPSLSQWNETQDKLQLTMQRNIYGVHAPVRSLMERQLVAKVRCIMDHAPLAPGADPSHPDTTGAVIRWPAATFQHPSRHPHRARLDDRAERRLHS